MTDAAVLFQSEGHVARVTLNRPEAGNAIDRELAEGLAAVCRRINEDAGIYVVTLTGAGDVFCRGGEPDGDISESPAAALAAVECPVVVVVNGDALGPGLELALAGDIIIAAAGARFGLPQVAGGFIPADGGTQRLPRIVGRGRALEMLLTGDAISDTEALEAGLVSRVVPPEQLESEAATLAADIAAKGPVALRYLKEAVNQGLDMSLEQGLRLEADLYFLLHTTDDRTEGIKAFLEKRKPEYKGE